MARGGPGDHGQRFLARFDLGIGPAGERLRYGRSFDSREEPQRWIEAQHARQDELVKPVADQRLDDDLRWGLEHRAPSRPR
jgi:hypothetical protein